MQLHPKHVSRLAPAQLSFHGSLGVVQIPFSGCNPDKVIVMSTDYDRWWSTGPSLLVVDGGGDDVGIGSFIANTLVHAKSSEDFTEGVEPFMPCLLQSI